MGIGAAAEQGLPHHKAEGVDVGRGARGSSLQLLGRRIGHRAARHVAQAEVDEPCAHCVIGLPVDVLGLDVAVAKAGCVHRCKGVEEGDGQSHRLIDSKRPRIEAVFEGDTRRQLHRQEPR